MLTEISCCPLLAGGTLCGGTLTLAVAVGVSDGLTRGGFCLATGLCRLGFGLMATFCCSAGATALGVEVVGCVVAGGCASGWGAGAGAAVVTVGACAWGATAIG